MIDGNDVKQAVRDLGSTGAYASDENLKNVVEALGIDFDSVRAAVQENAPYAPEAFFAGFVVAMFLVSPDGLA